MEFDVVSAFERVHRTLAPALDIVAGRIQDERIPAWCEERGWTDFLLGLSAVDVERSEALGLAETVRTFGSVLADLVELVARVRAFAKLSKLDAMLVPGCNEDYRGVSFRKREQLSSLLGALPALATPARRIVDVGAGSGHLTRLAASHFERAALGLERCAERVVSANARADSQLRDPRFTPQYVVMDACRAPLELTADDLAIGLHACGELGDALVLAVAESGAGLALVSCCLQKISAPARLPLSSRGLALERETLGLSNLTSQAVGVETEIERTIAARRSRYALRCLLLARGLDIPSGAEMRGINRRRAHAGLAELAARALEQRGLPPASPAELRAHELGAARNFERMRRLSLPRNMLSRLVELSVVLDRALLLHERGYALAVATLCERAVTPRNIALFASRDRARLPQLSSEQTADSTVTV